MHPWIERSISNQQYVITTFVTLLIVTFSISPASGQVRNPDYVSDPRVQSQNLKSAQASSFSDLEVGQALDLPQGVIASVDFRTSDPAGYNIFSAAVSGFPRKGGDYLVLSSGFTSVVQEPNNSEGTSSELGGLRSPGGGNDMVQMVVELNVPEGATSLSFDSKFLSEEFPEYVGSFFNDGFIVEVGTSTFTVNENAVDAPDNVVFDENGNQITVNTTFGVTADNATGTTYDGATPVLTTTIPSIPSPSVTLIFSIFDVGDNIYDSAVFIDNLKFGVGAGDTNFADLELLGLEVNQAVQDWNNDVPLVERKETWVRAHLQQTAGGDVGTAEDVRLKGWRNGNLLGIRPPSNPEFTAPSDTDSNSEIVDRRGDMSNSLNFRLPDDWLEGTVDLQLVRQSNAVLGCSNAVSDTYTDCQLQVSFDPVATPRIRFIRVRWTGQDGERHVSSDLDILELQARLIAMYPASARNFDFDNVGEITIPRRPNTLHAQEFLNELIFNVRYNELLNCPRSNCGGIYYGDYTGGDIAAENYEAHGLAFIGGSVGSGANGVSLTPLTPGSIFTRNIAAHEIGHALGLRHVEACGASDGNPYDNVFDYFGFFRDFDYFAEVNGIEVATLGSTDVDDLISYTYGLNTAFREPRPRDPLENFELMSYCLPSWTSRSTYNRIKEKINDRFGGTSSQLMYASGNLSREATMYSAKSAAQSAGAQQAYKVFRGLIDLSDDTTAFLPFRLISNPATTPPTLPTGDYTLQLIDDGDTVVEEFSFSPIRLSPGTASFIIPGPDELEIQQVNVLHDGQLIGSKSASANSPNVEVMFPNGGESLSGDQATFTWTANDADEDSLTYQVEYSRDGGATWETLVVDWPNKALDVEVNSLGGTDNGLIRVMASDGFNAVADVSNTPFTTSNSAPTVLISSPSEESFAGIQPIFFEGLAVDKEDGQLTGASLEWHSDQDGLIGTGRIFNIEAAQLSEGTHNITLTATDEGGLSDVVSVSIEVVQDDAETIVTDDTPPVCGPINLEKNASGKLIAVSTSASDSESGIASVEFTRLENLDGFLNGTGNYRQGDVETFDAGSISSVDIRGERIDMNAGGTILTTVTNGVGLTAQCDPVVESITAEVPDSFKLMGNYPNPFSQQTTIEFGVAEPVVVSLEVYDVLGRKVATLADEEMAPGTYKLTWDGRDESGQPLSSGVYIYRIDAGSFTATRKLTLVR